MTAPAPAPGAARVAGLARIVGEALAPTSGDARPEEAKEIRAITDAVVRLLIGTPLRSEGQLTIVSLATEAGLRRNKLTHKYTGLKDLFYALAMANGDRPGPAAESARTRRQQADLVRVRAERDELRAQTQLLARVVQVLEIENHRPKETNAVLQRHRTAQAGIPDLASRGRPAL